MAEDSNLSIGSFHYSNKNTDLEVYEEMYLNPNLPLEERRWAKERMEYITRRRESRKNVGWAAVIALVESGVFFTLKKVDGKKFTENVTKFLTSGKS